MQRGDKYWVLRFYDERMPTELKIIEVSDDDCIIDECKVVAVSEDGYVTVVWAETGERSTLDICDFKRVAYTNRREAVENTVDYFQGMLKKFRYDWTVNYSHQRTDWQHCIELIIVALFLLVPFLMFCHMFFQVLLHNVAGVDLWLG